MMVFGLLRMEFHWSASVDLSVQIKVFKLFVFNVMCLFTVRNRHNTCMKNRPTITKLNSEGLKVKTLLLHAVTTFSLSDLPNSASCWWVCFSNKLLGKWTPTGTEFGRSKSGNVITFSYTMKEKFHLQLVNAMLSQHL